MNFTALDFLIMKTQDDLTQTRNNLIHYCHSIESTMLKEAEKLENDENYVPNSLGILQFSGIRVDALCAIYSEQQKTLNELKHLKAQEEKK